MAAIPNAVLTKTACSTKSRTVGALVMGGDYRGLALVRSLGRRGIPVCVIRQGDQRLAAISRYATRTLFYPRWVVTKVSIICLRWEGNTPLTNGFYFRHLMK